MQEEEFGLITKTKLPQYKKIVTPIFNTLMLIILFLLIGFMLSMVIQQSKEGVGISFIQKQQLKKPLIDKNIYQHITLANGLQVLLIENPQSLISQVALSVQAGSFQEPDNYGGLAHLLEHMLFVGTHTYPDPAFFNNLIAQNGGSNNAYTDNYETNYYFTSQNAGLKQALDVFSHFFIDPLLDQSMVEKEVNAVNNEYEIASNTDDWKYDVLMKKLSNHKHPFSKFSIGNLETLLKNEISVKLREFFDTYYSANLMALVIESSLPIEEQKQLLGSFEQIKNKNLDQPSCEEFGQPLREGPSLLKYKLNTQNKRIQISHQLSDVQYQYKSKSIEFINKLVSSNTGLKEILIQKKLIISFDSGVIYNEHNGCFSVFYIDLQVFDVNDYDKILQTVYSYYNFLINQLFDDKGDYVNDNEKLRSLYDDAKRSAALRFNFNEDIVGEVMDISHNLNFYGYHDSLSRRYLYEEYDPEQIYFYLSSFLDLDNLIIFLGDPQLSNAEYDKLNKVHYQYLEMPGQIVTSLSGQQEQIKFKLPVVSKYYPNDLEMKSFCKPYEKSTEDPYEVLNENKQESLIQKSNQEMVFSSVEVLKILYQECKENEKDYEFIYPLPEFIHRSSIGKLWWKLDRSYQLPQVFMGMKIDKINFQATIKHQTQLQVFEIYTTQLILKNMESAFYNKYKIQFESSPNNIVFNLYGWSDGFESFVQDVLSYFVNSNIDEQIFQQALETLISDINEEATQPLYRQARNHYLMNTLKYGYFSGEQILKEVKQLSISDFTQFHSQLFKGTNFQMYLTGNILREESLNLFQKVEKKLFGKPKHLDYSPTYQKILKLSNNYIIPYQMNSNDNNGATLNYYIFGNRNRRQFAIMNLLKDVFNTQAFNYLRTDLQLGYVATAKFMPLECLDGAAILVQGSAESPYKVNQHMEDFLKVFYESIEQMTDIDLDELKKSTIQQLRQNEKTLFEKGISYWGHIQNNDFIFEEKDITIDEIEEITKQNVLNFLETAFKKSQKISIQLYGKSMLKEPLEEYIKKQADIQSFSSQPEKVSDKEKIKSGAMLYQCSFKLGWI